MTTFRQMCAALTLTLILAVSVLAGEIHCPGVTSTNTDTTSTTDVTTTIVLTVITVAY
jgi:hypothetical protein